MTPRHFIAANLSAFVVATAFAHPALSQQTVRRDPAPRVIANASVDSLVECTPVATPARKAPAPVKRKPTASRRKAAVKAAPKSTPTPRKVAAAPRRVARTTKPVVRKPAPVRNAAAHTTTVVMCKPVRLAPLAQGQPVEQSIVPVPQLAPKSAPAVTTAPEVGPPLFVSTAPGMPITALDGGRSWLPFSLVPAVFVPFVHNGTTHHGNTPPTDTTTPPDSVPVKPPVDTVPVTPPVDTVPVTPPVDTVPVTPPVDTVPVTPPTDTIPIHPPTTVPEPGSLVLLGTGLLGLGAVVSRRKRRK